MAVGAQELSRAQQLNSYLENLVQSGEATEETARRAWDAWENVAEASADLVPDASPGARGQILFTWNRGKHHFEMEVFPSGPIEFFYRNRTTGQFWEYDHTIGDPLPHAVKQKLSLFLYIPDRSDAARKQGNISTN